jgi:hypothetical protein
MPPRQSPLGRSSRLRHACATHSAETATPAEEGTVPHPRRRTWKTAFALVGAALLTLVLLEAGIAGLVAAGVLDLAPPRYGDALLWDGDNQHYGVWHPPNAQAVQKSDCFQVVYRTNSVGARDVERTLDVKAPRVVVLGDSFAEGWGVPEGQRFSNRLAAASGLEHLNFAMAHFGPYQEVLVYRELVQRYAHSAVLATVVPVNDFVDLDYEAARRATAYEHRYRPYLVRDAGGGFRRLDYREPWLAHWLRRNTWIYAATDRLMGAVRQRLFGTNGFGGYETALSVSHFYDFSAEQYALLEHSLELLAESARGRKLAIVLIPSQPDLERYERDGPDPLSARLAAFAERSGARVVNLLPGLHAAARGTPEGFAHFQLACDYHWNAAAHDLAARLIQEALAGFVYPLSSEPAPAPPRGLRRAISRAPAHPGT